MERCLESSKHFDNNSCWLGAFLSRIRESISGNNIISFLETELETEQNYAQVWLLVTERLTTRDITTARVMLYCTSLFRLKCENRGKFLVFYSNSKVIIHKLKKENMVAVGGGFFFKAYFAMIVEAPKL